MDEMDECAYTSYIIRYLAGMMCYTANNTAPVMKQNIVHVWQ